MEEIYGTNLNGYNKTWGSYLGVAPVDLTSWDSYLVPQELKFKVSKKSELNCQRYRELTKMASIRHGLG